MSGLPQESLLQEHQSGAACLDPTQAWVSVPRLQKPGKVQMRLCLTMVSLAHSAFSWPLIGHQGRPEEPFSLALVLGRE